MRNVAAATLVAVLGLGLLYLVGRRASPPAAPPVTVSGGTAARPLATAVQAFKPGQILSVLPRDAIPAIDDPRFIPADQARLGDDDRVIGVELDGEARAYPVGTLSRHEIVNDTIRGRPIAVTW